MIGLAARHVLVVVCLALTAVPPAVAGQGHADANADAVENGELETLRRRLVAVVSGDLRRTLPALGRLEPDGRILQAMATVPRHAFVPEELVPYAYVNRPLPVGHGQTVSQPSIVALMTEMAALEPDDRVLLVGIGGGYHAALLSRLAARVYCVALVEPVAGAAVQQFSDLDYDNIEVRIGDGYYGWDAPAPFDAVIVRQALNHVPPALLRQLKPGGRLVMPIGPPDATQFLTLVQKKHGGGMAERRVLPVRFTTMPGGSRI